MIRWTREKQTDVNIGIADARGRPPHLVTGDALLKQFGIQPGSREAHAYTHLNYVDAARTYGKVGGFAHLASLVKQVRAQRPGVHCCSTAAILGRARPRPCGATGRTWWMPLGCWGSTS